VNLAAKLLCLSLSLLILPSLGQAPTPLPGVARALGVGSGFAAEGEVTAYGPAGASAGAITVWIWGASHRRVRIAFPIGSGYEAVLSGDQSWSRGAPAIMSLPPGVLARGLALLPQGLPIGPGGKLTLVDLGAPPGPPSASAHRWGFTRMPSAALANSAALKSPIAMWLDLDGSSGLPARAGASVRGHEIEVRYSEYETVPVPAPKHVEVWRDGKLLLRADFHSIAPHIGFAESDFPASPAKEAQ